MRVALVSLNQHWEDKEANFQDCSRHVSEAKKIATELIIFPEMTLTGFSMDSTKLAEPIHNSKSLELFKDLAQTHSIAIQFGLAISENNCYYNCAITLDQNGKVISNYRKMHPFSFANENKYFCAGDKLSNFNYQGVNFGSTICYDLRFPEIYSALTKNSQAIINIANWPTKRIDHWRKLMMARAIENQVFLIGVNRTGIDGNHINYQESSMIVDPSGIQLQALYQKPPLYIYDVDFNAAEAYRADFPTFQDRRPDLYKKYI